MSERVIPISGVDARYLIPLEENVDICTIDITFASLRKVLPNIKNFLKKNGDIIALVKPIFETEFRSKPKLNIIHDRSQLFHILNDLIQWNIENHFFPYGIIR